MLLGRVAGERLAQLHQLRGRVGRGDKQSYCYLVYKESISETAYARIRSLESYSNGFKIAEEDLKLRGAGEYLGNRQSGYNDNLKIASPEDIIVNFNDPQLAITPGQSIVFYQNDNVIGGAITQ